jgi:ATP-dependent Clp protease protease subunit
MLKVNAMTGEIFIDDIIGADWFGEGITTKAVNDALVSLNGARASVRINSPGGSADEGIAIYNALKRYKGGVDTYNEALAASAASLIFLAGENRTMLSGSKVMIHKAMILAAGNSEQLRKTADTLDTYDKGLVEIYADYIDANSDSIMELLASETWYNSQDALDAGLATSVDAKKSYKPKKAAAWFRNAPADLVTNEKTEEHEQAYPWARELARIKARI